MKNNPNRIQIVVNKTSLFLFIHEFLFSIQLVPNLVSFSIGGHSHLISRLFSEEDSTATLFWHWCIFSNFRFMSLQSSCGPILSFTVDTNLFSVMSPQTEYYLLLSLNLGITYAHREKLMSSLSNLTVLVGNYYKTERHISFSEPFPNSVFSVAAVDVSKMQLVTNSSPGRNSTGDSKSITLWNEKFQ